MMQTHVVLIREEGLQLQLIILKFLQEDLAAWSLLEHHRILGEEGKKTTEWLVNSTDVSCRRKLMKFQPVKPQKGVLFKKRKILPALLWRQSFTNDI